MTRVYSLWGNLPRRPVRISPATTSQQGSTFDGLVKIRLCHGKGRTYFIPDILIGFRETKFYLPSFFGPPQLTFNIPGGSASPGRKHHSASFSMDVAPPRGTTAARLLVSFRSDGHVRSYNDGAQLYRCTYSGQMNTPLARHVAGDCSKLPCGDFAIKVFHHTTAETLNKIRASGELWSGPSNLAGTRKLENVAHTYFTTLPEIRDEADLRRIAMSSGGSISYQTTSDLPVENVLDLPVYRSSTADRMATLEFNVPCQIVAPAHLLLHPCIYPNSAYYEVVGPEIVRVAVNPGSKLAFVGTSVTVSASDLKSFDYVVEGDASTTEGLEAPMREETTAQIAHREKLDQGLDIFEFWMKHANTNQFVGRDFEARKLLQIPSRFQK
jgi:hypothetical protein